MSAKKEVKPRPSNQKDTSNTATVYMYNPEDFIGVMNLSNDLAEFYKLYENYQNDNTQDNLFALNQINEELFFTIKHRRVEGSITPQLADELNKYLGELLYD